MYASVPFCSRRKFWRRVSKSQHTGEAAIVWKMICCCILKSLYEEVGLFRHLHLIRKDLAAVPLAACHCIKA